MSYPISPAYWTHSVLLKIGQYTKSNLMIFVVTLHCDIIGI